MPSTPARAAGPNPDSQPSRSRCPAEVVGNSATASSPPTGSSAAATLRSRCVSTPPVTWRGAARRSGCVFPLPDSAAGCDRPAGAGRSTALRAVLAPHQPGPSRQIVIKTGKPSADSRARPEPKRGRSYSFTNRKVTDCHRSTLLHHFLRSAPVGLSPHTPCRFGADIGRELVDSMSMQIVQLWVPAMRGERQSAGAGNGHAAPETAAVKELDPFRAGRAPASHHDTGGAGCRRPLHVCRIATMAYLRACGRLIIFPSGRR